jgi:hypothetical protein
MQYARIRFGIVATLALAALGILYYQAVVPIIDLGESGGSLSGPFSWVVGDLQTVAAPLIVVLLLMVWVYVLAGGAREERAVRRRR